MELGPYNTELKLFPEPFHGFNYHKLFFLRQLAINGKLEHPALGNPTGELIPGMVERFGGNALNKLKIPATYAERLRAKIEETGEM